MGWHGEGEGRFRYAFSSCNLSSFVYNGDGNRVKSTENGATTTYLGNYYEWNGTAGLKYYYAGGQRVAMRDATGTLYFLLGDHLGSTTVVADASGNLTAEQLYQPWGAARYSSGTIPTSLHFTGQPHDSYNQLYLMGARWYDPWIGRFASADSIVPGAGNPQALNRYSYSLSNPLKYTDPTGHRPTDGCETEGCTDDSGHPVPIVDIDTLYLHSYFLLLISKYGIDSSQVRDLLLTVGVTLDISALTLDGVATLNTAAWTVGGATVGGGIGFMGLHPVTGPAGALVGAGIAELQNQPMLFMGNLLASASTVTTIASDFVVTGNSNYHLRVTQEADGALTVSASVELSPSSWGSLATTFAGWASPISVPSLLLQSIAVANDLSLLPFGPA